MTAALMKVRVSRDIEIEGLGERIEEARRKDSRPVEVLAKAAGISRGYWYDLEKERIRQSLPLETLQKIEEVLNVQLLDKGKIDVSDKNF